MRRRDCFVGERRRTQHDGTATSTASSRERPTATGWSTSGNALKPSRARTLAPQTPAPAARALKPTQAKPTMPSSSRC